MRALAAGGRGVKGCHARVESVFHPRPFPGRRTRTGRSGKNGFLGLPITDVRH